MFCSVRRPVVAVAIVLGASIPGAASAQQAQGFVVNRFEPSERGSDWFSNESLDLRGSVRPAFGVVGDYSYRSLVIHDPDGTVRHSPVRNMFFAHLGGSVVLADRFRLSLSLPLQVFADGKTGQVGSVVYTPPPDEQGVGDLRFGGDMRLFGAFGDAITGAIGVQVWAPTGSRAQYTSDGEIRVRPRALLAGDIGAFVYAGQVNVAYRGRSETLSGGAIGSEIGFTASAGLRVADRKLVIGPELYGSTVFDDAFARRTTPVEGLFGAHYLAGDAVRLGAGIGTGLTRGFGSPELRALLSAEWAPGVNLDGDGDGIEDKDDACPTQAGIRTTDPKTNGCPAAKPEPSDRDHDGVLDTDDACIDVAGVRTTTPSTNGCPADRDQDGIADSRDACPDVAGVASSDPAKNGCPLDTDGDGVLDVDDACPTVAGLKTVDVTTNGCPDPDRDNDGIPNVTDACPDEPGPSDPDPKRTGCPKAFVKDGTIQILDQVKFATGSAVIDKGKDSDGVLQAVLKVLTEHTEIAKVRIEGHTDDRGAAALNKKLSAARAASVVKWLIAHGIDRGRLTSQGFGPERPISSNETEAGRRENRRVELHIEK